MATSTDSIRCVGEADLLEIARVARSTWRNWSKQGVVEVPPTGLYGEAHAVEASLVALFVTALDLRQAAGCWRPARERVLELAVAQPRDDDLSAFDVVIDLHRWELNAAVDRDALVAVLHRPTPFPRGRLVFDAAHVVADARTAFWARAVAAAELKGDKRRKPRAAVRGAPARGG